MKILRWIKWLTYLPANEIIVTDKNRFDLMPAIVRSKCVVVANYPERLKLANGKQESGELRILYNGTMNLNRGTKILQGLLKTGLPLKIYMAGWVSDEETEDLIKKYEDQIEFLGVIPQEPGFSFGS